MNTTPSIVGNVIIIVCLDVIFLVIFKYFVSNRFNSLSSHRGKPENPGKNCRQLFEVNTKYIFLRHLELNLGLQTLMYAI